MKAHESYLVFDIPPEADFDAVIAELSACDEDAIHWEYVDPTWELQLGLFLHDLAGGVLVRLDERELHFRAAQVMLALEGYRLSMGEYPLTLEALVPAYLDRLPADPFSGNPLCYRRLHEDDPALRGRSYLLYSVGGDLRDNGGRDLRDRSSLARRDMLKYPPPAGARALDYILTPPDR
jgi:hypothetical protein